MTPLYLATEDQLSEAVGERLVTEANLGLQVAVCMGRKGNAYLRQKLPELAALSSTMPVLMLTARGDL